MAFLETRMDRLESEAAPGAGAGSLAYERIE